MVLCTPQRFPQSSFGQFGDFGASNGLVYAVPLQARSASHSAMTARFGCAQTALTTRFIVRGSDSVDDYLIAFNPFPSFPPLTRIDFCTVTGRSPRHLRKMQTLSTKRLRKRFCERTEETETVKSYLTLTRWC